MRAAGAAWASKCARRSRSAASTSAGPKTAKVSLGGTAKVGVFAFPILDPNLGSAALGKQSSRAGKRGLAPNVPENSLMHFGTSRAAVDRAKGENLLRVEHPLSAARLTVLRAKRTAPDEFRRNLQELSAILFCEASRGWEAEKVRIETPLRECDGAILAKQIVLVPILRAGLGMLEGMLRIASEAAIGHIGLYRDEATLRPVSYYSRFPASLGEAEVLLLDPMLATGHSATAAVRTLKSRGAKSIQLITIVSCLPGIAQFHAEHPEVRIVTAAVDPELNDKGYIVPGLGDAGDRYFGTC